MGGTSKEEARKMPVANFPQILMGPFRGGFHPTPDCFFIVNDTFPTVTDPMNTNWIQILTHGANPIRTDGTDAILEDTVGGVDTGVATFRTVPMCTENMSAFCDVSLVTELFGGTGGDNMQLLVIIRSDTNSSWQPNNMYFAQWAANFNSGLNQVQVQHRIFKRVGSSTTQLAETTYADSTHDHPTKMTMEAIGSAIESILSTPDGNNTHSVSDSDVSGSDKVNTGFRGLIRVATAAEMKIGKFSNVVS